MTLLSSFLLVLLLTFGALSCAFVMEEFTSTTEESHDENRQLGAATSRGKIKPKGSSKVVSVASNGKVKRRRSILDLSGLLLDDTVQDVDVQLMSDEQSQTLRMRRANTNNDPFESWYGRDAKTGNHLTIVKTKTQWGETVTTGTMHGQNGTVYQIRTLPNGKVVAEKIKQEMFDKELDGVTAQVRGGGHDIDPETIDAVDRLPGGGRRGLQNLRRLDSSSQLDVMVLYTKGAMCSAAGFGSGGTCTVNAENQASIEGIIALAVAETNKVYELSGIPTSFRLVKTHYDDSYNDYASTWSSTLASLRNNGDGKLDYVHAMRDQYGADFVSMLVDTSGYCGIGYLPSSPSDADAFTLVHWSCATGYYSFANGIGHNMGCQEDALNAGGYAGGYNYGYQDPSARFRSILAYDCGKKSCPRVQYFSSPDLSLMGSPLGTAKANNALVIRNNLAAFANYRQSIPVTPVSYAPMAVSTAVARTAPTALISFLPKSQSVTTTFSGGFVGAEGHMFDVKSTKDLSITNFAVHALSASRVTVEVYMKKKTGKLSSADSNPDNWQMIKNVSFVTNAAGTPSILPADPSYSPVLIKAGVTQSFYITFTPDNNLNRYSEGSELGKEQASNSDLTIYHGYATFYRFDAFISLRGWNGIVYYQTVKPYELAI